MTDAHKVIDYIKGHFDQSDLEIVILLSQGVLIMKDIQRQMIKKGVAKFDQHLILKLEEMDAYLSDVIEEELA